MSRLFWIGLGAAAGVLVARRLTRAAQQLTPAGISSSIGESVRELGDAFSYFADQVREGMAERETQLYDSLGIRADATAARPSPEERR